MLSDNEIEKIADEHLKAFSQFPLGGQVWFEGEVEFAHAIEAEVRKQDTYLIRQLLEALETYQGFIDDAHIIDGQFHWLDDAKPAITAANIRLENK